MTPRKTGIIVPQGKLLRKVGDAIEALLAAPVVAAPAALAAPTIADFAEVTASVTSSLKRKNANIMAIITKNPIILPIIIPACLAFSVSTGAGGGVGVEAVFPIYLA